MKYAITIFFLLVSLVGAQQTMVNGNGDGISNPTLFMTALGAAPLNGATFTNMISLRPTSTGSEQLLRVGNTELIPMYGSSDQSGTGAPSGITGTLSVYSNTNFGVLTHSKNAQALLATTTDGEAIKAIQKNQTYATTDTAVVRVLRQSAASGIGYVSSPLVVISDEAASAGYGGPVLKVLKNQVITLMIDNRGKLILKDTTGSGYHALNVSSTGTVTSEVFVP